MVPFQEVIRAWRDRGSLYNLPVPRVDGVLAGTVPVPIPRLAQERAVAKAAPKHCSWDEDPAALGPTNLTPQPGHCLKEPGFYLQAVFVPSRGPCWWAQSERWGRGVPFCGCLRDMCMLSPALPLSRLTCQVVQEFGLCCRQSEALVENCPCVKIKRRECHVLVLPSPAAAEGAGTALEVSAAGARAARGAAIGRAYWFHPSQTSPVWFVQSKRTPGPPQGCPSPKPSCLPHCGGLCPSHPTVPGLRWRSPAGCRGSAS